jgi:hypothetical protein
VTVWHAKRCACPSRLAELHVDIDVVSAEIFKLAPSGVAFRFVNEGLQKLGKLAPTQSFFNTRSDNLDRDQLMLLAQVALEMYQTSTRPRSSSRPLREKMQGVRPMLVSTPAVMLVRLTIARNWR